MNPRAILLAIAAFSGLSQAQEAASGFDLRATITGEGVYSSELSEPPRSGSDFTAGARLLLYPTWKLNTHWTVTAAIQGITRPYYYTDFSTQGYGIKTD